MQTTWNIMACRADTETQGVRRGEIGLLVSQTKNMARQTGTGLYSVHQMAASQVRDRVAQAHTMPHV